jgi:hypothetical protein
LKVGIVSPARDIVDTGFAFDAQNMIGYTCAHHRDIALASFVSKGTMIFNQRIDLAREAMSEGCDWILWLDTDMRFPKDTLIRLLAHKKDIVAANYVTRQVPPEPVSFQLTDEGKIWRRVPTVAASTGLQKVTGAPMGCMLTSTKVFRKLDKPDVPMFWFQYSTKNHTTLGEDIYFCINAGRYGFDIFIDHDLSKQVRHVGIFEYGHEHVDENTAASMLKELAAATTTDLNRAPAEDKKSVPVIPLAHAPTPKMVGAEGIHKDVIAAAINRQAGD